MNRLPEILGIALGGAVGAVSRFSLTGLIATRIGRGFPWATLAINITGSLMLGFLFAFLHDRLAVYLGPSAGICVACAWMGFGWG